MNCLKCGRALKNKTSIARGYGPGCYKKVQAEVKKDYETREERIEIDGQVDILEELKQRRIS